MPDGSLIPQSATEHDLSPKELLTMLMKHASESLQLAIDEQGVDPKTVDVDALMKSYAEHVHERMAQSATTLGFEISNARVAGRRELEEELANVKRAASVVLERSKDSVFGQVAPASTRNPMGKIVEFTAGAAAQLRKNVGLGLIAVAGMVRRQEIPALDRRVEAVYLSNAIGQALGDAMALHLALNGMGDASLVRAMREAALDGLNRTFGPVAEAFTGRVN